MTTYDEETKVFMGRQCEKNYKNTDTLGRRVFETLIMDCDHVAQICVENDKSYTNCSLADMTISIASNLEKLCVVQCEVIGIYSQNNAFVAPIVFGAMLSGMIVSPLDPSCPAAAMSHTCLITNPKIIFCDGRDYLRVKENLKSCWSKPNIFTIQNHIPGVRNLDEFFTGGFNCFEPKPLQFGLSQIAVIVTSFDKAFFPICVSISNEGILRTIATEPAPVSSNVSLCFRGFQVSEIIADTILKRVRVITESDFSPQNMLKLIEKYKVNTIFPPPFDISLLLDTPEIMEYDLSSVTSYYIGTATVAPQLVERMKLVMKNVKLFRGYTLPEANGAPICFGELRSDDGMAPLLSNVKVKIIDDAGQSKGPGEIGEICIYQSVPWPGYYKNQRATAEVQDSENWLHSGDLGYIDMEGILFIIDRKEDIFKHGENFFSPKEIENNIYRIPDVLEACGFAMPSYCVGHLSDAPSLPAAAVTLKPGSTITGDYIRNTVTLKYSTFKYLFGGVYVFNWLPRTTNGELNREAIAAQCELRTRAAQELYNIRMYN